MDLDASTPRYFPTELPRAEQSEAPATKLAQFEEEDVSVMVARINAVYAAAAVATDDAAAGSNAGHSSEELVCFLFHINIQNHANTFIGGNSRLPSEGRRYGRVGSV